MEKTFQIGNKFQHYNGYIWEIKQINGNQITIMSNQEHYGCIQDTITTYDLIGIIKAGYYKQIN